VGIEAVTERSGRVVCQEAVLALQPEPYPEPKVSTSMFRP
jgi:hypothetical protein